MHPRILVVLLTFLLAPLVLAAPASADTATLQFVDAAGTSDPVAGIGRTATITGNTASEKSIYVRYRAAGGAPCAPSASTDSGEAYHWYGGTDVNGNFKVTYNDVWSAPGTYVFCIWLARKSTESATPIAQTITFRNPTGTISGTVAPVSPLAGEAATITVSGSSEAPQSVYGTIRPAGGAPCGVSASVDGGDRFVSGEEVNGAFSLQRSVTRETAGDYLVCLWLADSSDDPTPIAGPQAFTYTVAAPCIVPELAPGAKVAKAQRKLNKAGCAVGATKLKRSSVRKGRFLRFKPAAGTRLPPGTAIALVVSKGR